MAEDPGDTGDPFAEIHTAEREERLLRRRIRVLLFDRLVAPMNRRHFLLSLSSAPLLAQTPAPTTTPATPAPASAPAPPALDWVDAKKLTIEGLGFRDVKLPYDRLPGKAEGVVRPAVWNLS